MKARIYVSADKTSATVVKVTKGAWKTTSEESTYKLVGKRSTPIDEICKIYPNAEVINE